MLADRMLGKLARFLRMAGQDVEYVREGDPLEIARRAALENRVLLTRDRKLATRKDHGEVLFIESRYPYYQTRQVVRELKLEVNADFRRCFEDNGTVQEISSEDAKTFVPPYVLESAHTFYRCERCANVYWNGSHVTAMREMVASIGHDAASAPTPNERED
jgi:uncharacterized protein with PIN domain